MLNDTSKCGARTRAGMPCEALAMPNGRCRLHGGMSPGAPKGNRNAWKHGRFAAETIAERRRLVAFVRQMREGFGAVK